MSKSQQLGNITRISNNDDDDDDDVIQHHRYSEAEQRNLRWVYDTFLLITKLDRKTWNCERIFSECIHFNYKRKYVSKDGLHTIFECLGGPGINLSLFCNRGIEGGHCCNCSIITWRNEMCVVGENCEKEEEEEDN